MKIRQIKKLWRRECDSDPVQALARYGALPLSVRRKLGQRTLATYLGSSNAELRTAAIRAAEHLPPANENPYGRKSKPRGT